jgi:hypothetical protein
MTGSGFFATLRFLFLIGFIVLAALAGFTGYIWSELNTESRFRKDYGKNWETEYEQTYGPVSDAHAKIAVCGVGIVSVTSLTVWLGRILRPRRHPGHSHSHGKKKHRERYSSPMERLIVHRRKALPRVVCGVPAILLGVFLVIFRTGIFRQHSDEIVLGIFVFLAGYCCVISGCWHWLQAKQWNEAIVFIGLMPLAILMIPFVRLLVLTTPILPVGMVMMPLILVVVVLALPDQSGLNKRESWSDRGGAGWRKLEKLGRDSATATGPGEQKTTETGERNS